MERIQLNPEILAAVETNDSNNGNNGGQNRQMPLFTNETIKFTKPENGKVTDLLVDNPATDQLRADGTTQHINAWSGIKSIDGRVFSVARLFAYANSMVKMDNTPFLTGATRNERVAEFLQYVDNNPNGITVRLISDKEHRGRFYSQFRVEGAVVNPFAEA